MDEAADNVLYLEGSKTPLLGYFTRGHGTPTRVRLVAGRACLIIGCVFVLAVASQIYSVASKVPSLAWQISSAPIIWHGPMPATAWPGVAPMGPLVMGGKAPPTWSDYGAAMVAIMRSPDVSGALVLTMIPAVGMFLIAAGVKRGRRKACTGAMFIVELSMVELVVAFGWFVEVKCYAIFLSYGPVLTVVTIIGVGLVAGLGFLALRDLLVFLRWIRRNPETEKSAVNFLPVRKGT